MLKSLPGPQPVGAAVVLSEEHSDDGCRLKRSGEQPLGVPLRGEVPQGKVFAGVLEAEYRPRQARVWPWSQVLVHPAVALVGAVGIDAVAALGLCGQAEQPPRLDGVGEPEPSALRGRVPGRSPRKRARSDRPRSSASART